MELSIVIPVYNGAKSIERLVDELAKLDINGGVEVILVNDYSPDNSWEVIERIYASSPMRVVAIDLAKNFGEHNAVMAGYAAAKGRFIINIDDDFQNPPSEVRKLYAYAASHPELDVVYTYYAIKQHSWFRNLGSRLNDQVATYLLDKPKGLYLSSFRCVGRMLRDRFLVYKGPYPHIDGLILENTRHIGRIQVQHSRRAEGRSGYTIRRLIRLWMIMFIGFSVMPLRFSSIMGFLFSGVGFVLAIYVIYESIFLGTPQGWASIVAAVMIFAGIQLLILGLIGEYVGRLFLMQKGKPQYVVRSVLDREAEQAE